MIIYKVVLNSRTVIITEDEYMALIGLMSKDPLKGIWDKIPHRERCEMLFGKGLIDCHGNQTDIGKEVCAAIEKSVEESLEFSMAEREMRELDKLDAKLRERPNSRQPVDEFNYGE